MLSLRQSGPLECPILVCDACGHAITNARCSWIMWNAEGTPRLYSVHKDDPERGAACLATIEKMIGKDNCMSDETTTFFAQLLHNAGMSELLSAQGQKLANE